jgi:hypothetical protein
MVNFNQALRFSSVILAPSQVWLHHQGRFA